VAGLRQSFIIQDTNQSPAWFGGGDAMHAFIWTLIKVLIASLIAGVILNHLGITPEELIYRAGMTPAQLEDLARQGIAWAVPNIALGAVVIVPVWFLIFLFRPPGRNSNE
jgi:hypothetical protein